MLWTTQDMAGDEMQREQSILNVLSQSGQMLATAILAAAAAAATAWTFAALAGLAPWAEIPVTIGGLEYPAAGMALQLIFTAVFLSLLAFLPGSRRVMQLERTHRDFAISMSDVMEAYAACHAADRQGAFTLSEQFDAVKERIAWLRRHPDLGNLEPDVLEAAAQMSLASHELAETYSDDNIARAEAFLRQRQEEIAAFESRIQTATAAMHRLRRWTEQVEVEESVMRSQLDRLEEEFGDLLEEMGFRRTGTPDNLYPLRIAAE